jgi:hypothetical protein
MSSPAAAISPGSSRRVVVSCIWSRERFWPCCNVDDAPVDHLDDAAAALQVVSERACGSS